MTQHHFLPQTASEGSFLPIVYTYIWILDNSNIYVDGLDTACMGDL